MSDEQDAMRYRWLRERLEVRTEESMAGTFRLAIATRIGRSFIDTVLRPEFSPLNAKHNARLSQTLDDAIDGVLTANPESKP